jgi:hypothetical protein
MLKTLTEFAVCIIWLSGDLATDLSHERYVVEVVGIAKAEYPNIRFSCAH